jgi:predicted transcriptional regulator
MSKKSKKAYADDDWEKKHTRLHQKEAKKLSDIHESLLMLNHNVKSLAESSVALNARFQVTIDELKKYIEEELKAYGPYRVLAEEKPPSNPSNKGYS